ncbi:MAG: glycosyltransferase family 4 protein [Bacteroidota bacterium]
MKLLLSAFDCDPFAGSEAAIGWGWTYYNALAGHEVWCITQSKNQENLEKFCEEHPIPNLHFIYVEVDAQKRLHRIPTLGIYSFYLAWQKKAYQSAKTLSAEISWDLVHHVSYGSLQLGTYMWKLGIPLIFGPIGGGQFTPPIFKPYFYKEWWKEEFRKLSSFVLTRILSNSRKALSKAAFTAVTNEETYLLAQKLGAKRIGYFLDTGIKPEFFPDEEIQRIPSEPLKVLWVGRMLPRKGLLLAFEVFEKLDKNLSIKLTVLGGGDLERMREEVRIRGLTDRISCPGRVPFSEVADYYRNHDVFFFPSLRDSFGSQLLEAMSYKLPILSLNLFGAKVFVPEDAGIKVEVINRVQCVEDLEKALVRFLEEPVFRLRAGEAGHAFALSQNWPDRIRRMQKIYAELLEREKPLFDPVAK